MTGKVTVQGNGEIRKIIEKVINLTENNVLSWFVEDVQEDGVITYTSFFNEYTFQLGIRFVPTRSNVVLPSTSNIEIQPTVPSSPTFTLIPTFRFVIRVGKHRKVIAHEIRSELTNDPNDPTLSLLKDLFVKVTASVADDANKHLTQLTFMLEKQLK